MSELLLYFSRAVKHFVFAIKRVIRPILHKKSNKHINFATCCENFHEFTLIFCTYILYDAGSNFEHFDIMFLSYVIKLICPITTRGNPSSIPMIYSGCM